ncbi:MAG: hypothetical protein CYPHOPRED_005185 [Cyphobasidiales sp. Tagirdzhanova-0007]|nr:MAG: hypothetical protein CYPHOPRED_005185 [Cyphobasidiales sp. Tagirdzhanova-0007]
MISLFALDALLAAALVAVLPSAVASAASDISNAAAIPALERSLHSATPFKSHSSAPLSRKRRHAKMATKSKVQRDASVTIYSGSGQGTFYFDITGAGPCGAVNGLTSYPETNGYAMCEPSSGYKTLAARGSNKVVAIPSGILTGNEAKYCGKAVSVTWNGNTVSDLIVWDGCEACNGNSGLDFSSTVFAEVFGNSNCAAGRMDGLTWEILDQQVWSYPSGAPVSGDSSAGAIPSPSSANSVASPSSFTLDGTKSVWGQIVKTNTSSSALAASHTPTSPSPASPSLSVSVGSDTGKSASDSGDGSACDTTLQETAMLLAQKSLFVPTNYSVVTGVFIQDDSGFDASNYHLLNDSFGLIDKSENRWRNLSSYIENLNSQSDNLTAYKLIYIARHGEGYHNVAEALRPFVLRADDFFPHQYWSELRTDGNITWGPDPALTPKGINQALSVAAGWEQQMLADVPLPQALYSSPLRRSASTLSITWANPLLQKGVVPTFKENLRESIGLHTCDQRSTKSVIASEYPAWQFEPSFSENDELWNAVYEETSAQQALRTQQVLNELFATDSSTYLSITAHSGTINAFFRVVGHRMFGVQTGGFVPVLVKAVGHPDAVMPVITGGQSATQPLCTANPATAAVSPASASVIPNYAPIALPEQ